jgi:hypothetical protein
VRHNWTAARHNWTAAEKPTTKIKNNTPNPNEKARSKQAPSKKDRHKENPYDLRSSPKKKGSSNKDSDVTSSETSEKARSKQAQSKKDTRKEDPYDLRSLPKKKGSNK